MGLSSWNNAGDDGNDVVGVRADADGIVNGGGVGVVGDGIDIVIGCDELEVGRTSGVVEFDSVVDITSTTRTLLNNYE